MKLFAVFALLCVVVVSKVHAEDDTDVTIDKIPASSFLEAVQGAIEEGFNFVSVDGVITPVHYGTNGDIDANPLTFGLLKKKCKGSECRDKCHAKGQNGACVWIKCLCWK